MAKKNEKLPELRQEERYRIARRVLREAQAASRKAAKRYSEADAAHAARPDAWPHSKRSTATICSTDWRVC